MHLSLTIAAKQPQPNKLRDWLCVYSEQGTFTIAPASRGDMNKI